MLQVLVGTLFSGEREFDRCVEALKAQRYMLYRHFVIENLPESAAHEKLYEGFMERAHTFDLFLKLDADMVLADEDRLGAAVSLFEQAPRLDHAIFTVHDWMTDSPIIGINMYRSRVRWSKPETASRADEPPPVSGKRRCFRGPPSPLALHGLDPSPAQAFHYGLHRGQRAFQFRQEHVRPLEAIRHWGLLKRLWQNFERRLDPRMGLALLAVEHILTHPLSAADCNYTNPHFWQLLGVYAGMDPLHMRDYLRETFEHAAAPRADVGQELHAAARAPASPGEAAGEAIPSMIRSSCGSAASSQ